MISKEIIEEEREVEIDIMSRKRLRQQYQHFQQAYSTLCPASDSTTQGVGVFAHDPNGKVATAYAALTREVLSFFA